MLIPRDIRRRFDRAAAAFDSADFVHAATREGLLERLRPVLVEARTILDLGAATGATGRLLQRRFRRARVISLDFSHAMLAQARRKKLFLSKSAFVQADAHRLPFGDGAFDLVTANQLLPWIPDPEPVFREVGRVLKAGGVFAFATLGPDSLQAIARAWAAVDDAAHVNRFVDMHDIGDGLVRAGLADPVLDVDRLSISYDNAAKLFDDLTHVGGRNALARRPRGLIGRARFQALLDALPTPGSHGQIRLDLELVYGHCWGAGARSDPTHFRISANRIPLRR